MAPKTKKCEHPPCTCTAMEGSKYCSVECEAMEKTPDLEPTSNVFALTRTARAKSFNDSRLFGRKDFWRRRLLLVNAC
jgi:hypothetical protein